MRLCTCFLLFVLTALPANAAAPALKVMSFNVRYGSPLPETQRPGGKIIPADPNAWRSLSKPDRCDLVQQVIADYDPDLLGLQEPHKHQINDLAAKLPGHSFYGVGRRDGDGKGEYCGFFYRTNRFNTLTTGTFWLSKKPEQSGSKFPGTRSARIVSWVLLQDKLANDAEYLIFNTHWDHKIQKARLHSAKSIRSRLKLMACNRPVIVMGDLNAKAESPAFQLLVKPTPDNSIALLDSYREIHTEIGDKERTSHGFRGNTGGARIDYILHTSHFQVQEARIVRTHVGDRYPSDHFPVTATLQFKP